MIFVSESHLDNTVPDYKAELPTYNLFRRDRTRSGGGVAIYCANHLSPTRRHDLEHTDLELLWLELTISNKKHLFAVCYRPPGQCQMDLLH